MIDWLKAASVTAVARLFHLSWDAVDGVMQRAVRRGLARRQRTVAMRLGVDETSFQKRRRGVIGARVVRAQMGLSPLTAWKPAWRDRGGNCSITLPRSNTRGPSAVSSGRDHRGLGGVSVGVFHDGFEWSAVHRSVVRRCHCDRATRLAVHHERGGCGMVRCSAVGQLSYGRRRRVRVVNKSRSHWDRRSYQVDGGKRASSEVYVQESPHRAQTPGGILIVAKTWGEVPGSTIARCVGNSAGPAVRPAKWNSA